MTTASNLPHPKTVEMINKNLSSLQECILISINDIGIPANEIVMICGVYHSFWEEFIDGLNPDIKNEAAVMVKAGQKPISISGADTESFLEYLQKTQPMNVTIPNTDPDEGHVWGLFLHEDGFEWMQIQYHEEHRLAS